MEIISSNSEADLKKLGKEALVSICKEKGYKASGNISDLVTRIKTLNKYRLDQKIDMK